MSLRTFLIERLCKTPASYSVNTRIQTRFLRGGDGGNRTPVLKTLSTLSTSLAKT